LRQNETEARHPHDELRTGHDQDVPRRFPQGRHRCAAISPSRDGTLGWTRTATSPRDVPRTSIVRVELSPRSTEENTIWHTTTAAGRAAAKRRPGPRSRTQRGGATS